MNNNRPFGAKFKGICEMCEEEHRLTVTDDGAFCRVCLKDLARDGAFENFTDFELDQIGLSPDDVPGRV